MGCQESKKFFNLSLYISDHEGTGESKKVGGITIAIILATLLLLPTVTQPYKYSIFRANSPIVITRDEISYRERDGNGEILDLHDILNGGKEVDRVISKMREQMEDELHSQNEEKLVVEDTRIKDVDVGEWRGELQKIEPFELDRYGLISEVKALGDESFMELGPLGATSVEYAIKFWYKI